MSKNVTAMKSRTVYSVEGFNSPVHVVENTDAKAARSKSSSSVRTERGTAPQDGTLYQNISKMWFDQGVRDDQRLINTR